MTGPRTTARWGAEALTPREHEYWRLLALGKANAAIAIRAVERALGSIFWKLSLDSDATEYNRRVLAALAYWQND